MVKGEHKDTREMTRGKIGEEGKADKEREMEEKRECEQMQKMKEAGTPAAIKKDDARLAPKKRRNIFKKFGMASVQTKVEEEPIVAPTTGEETGKTPCVLGMSTSQIEISGHYP